jgi:hypothetical protein
MIRKLACAVFVMTIAIGFVAAEEFGAIVTKVDGGKVTFQKTKKGKADGTDVTLPTIDKVAVAKGKFSKDDKKWTAGDAIEGGLKASVFAKIGDKGVAVRITTDDDGKKITQILTTAQK